jgi:hypothetical protein
VKGFSASEDTKRITIRCSEPDRGAEANAASLMYTAYGCMHRGVERPSAEVETSDQQQGCFQTETFPLNNMIHTEESVT